MNFSYFWGRKSNKGSDKGRYFDGVDDAVSKEGDRRYYRAGDRRALRDPETDLLLSFCGYLCTDGLDAGIKLYGKPCRIRMWKNGCRNPTNKRKRIFI